MTGTIHEIRVMRDGTVLYDGVKVGFVQKQNERVIGRSTRNYRDAFDTDGNLIVESAYGNGGSDHVAARILVSRLGLLKDGDRHIDTNHRGERVAGPYTHRTNTRALTRDEYVRMTPNIIREA